MMLWKRSWGPIDEDLTLQILEKRRTAALSRTKRKQAEIRDDQADTYRRGSVGRRQNVARPMAAVVLQSSSLEWGKVGLLFLQGRALR